MILSSLRLRILSLSDLQLWGLPSNGLGHVRHTTRFRESDAA